MQAFVDSFDAAGFKASVFCPSYGLAEATLAVSLMPPGEGIRLELVEETELSGGTADEKRPRRYRAVVNCGRPVTGMDIARINSYWARLHFTGQVQPPLVVGDDDAVLARLHGDASAIGYVMREPKDPAVRVVLRLP
jgi:hypothetical protein